jgi:hypothetical protein
MSQSSAAVPAALEVTRSAEPSERRDSGEYEIEVDIALDRLCAGDTAPRKPEEFEGPALPTNIPKSVRAIRRPTTVPPPSATNCPRRDSTVGEADVFDLDDDDEITVELPAPKKPAHVPSPIANEDVVGRLDDKPANDTLAAENIDTTADTEPVIPQPMRAATRSVGEAAALAGVPAKPERSTSSAPPSKSTRSSDLRISEMIRIRQGVTPEAAQAARDARAIARREESKTQAIVFGIWTAAVILAGLFAYFVLFK